MKDSKKMMKREIDFMKRKKAPKDMLKHEMAEHATMKKFAGGGSVRGTGCATKGKKFSGVF
jgi:hypothetical protein